MLISLSNCWEECREFLFHEQTRVCGMAWDFPEKKLLSEENKFTFMKFPQLLFLTPV
jgi:hypothetical protein